MAEQVHVRKGDLVQALSGKDNGKRGKVLEVIPKKGRVIVDGVNITKRHTKPTKEMPQGGVVERPSPLDASKVQLVCGNCDSPVRIGHEREADGSVTRTCKECGRSID
jgi:large subunit ribosomal protein L24